jgi:hypothetical protein
MIRVIMRPEDAVEAVDLVVEQLLSQIGRCVDQQTLA